MIGHTVRSFGQSGKSVLTPIMRNTIPKFWGVLFDRLHQNMEAHDRFVMEQMRLRSAPNAFRASSIASCASFTIGKRRLLNYR